MISKDKIRYLMKLSNPSFIKQEGVFIVETPHLIEEGEQAGLLMEIYCTRPFKNGIIISEDTMRKITKTHTPPVAIGICKTLKKSEINDRILVLEEINDPTNLGSLLRSAKALGFNTIFLSDGSCSIYNDKVIRASQGAIFKLSFLHGEVVDFLNNIAKTHLIIGTDVIAGVSIKTIKKETKLALVLGNEARGLSNEAKALCAVLTHIPLDDMESLNVGVAGAILMYELFLSK